MTRETFYILNTFAAKKIGWFHPQFANVKNKEKFNFFKIY